MYIVDYKETYLDYLANTDWIRWMGCGTRIATPTTIETYAPDEHCPREEQYGELERMYEWVESLTNQNQKNFRKRLVLAKIEKEQLMKTRFILSGLGLLVIVFAQYLHSDQRGATICGVSPTEAVALTHKIKRDNDGYIRWIGYGPKGRTEFWQSEDVALDFATSNADEVNAAVVCKLDNRQIDLHVPDGWTTVTLRFWRIGRELKKDKDQDARKWLTP